MASVGSGVPRAIDMYRQSLGMRERISAADPADVYARGRVAYVHDQLAVLNMKLGQMQIARDHAHTAVRLNEGLAGIASSYRAQQGRALLTLGRIETADGGSTAACGSFIAASALLAGLSSDRGVADDNRKNAESAAREVAACRQRPAR